MITILLASYNGERYLGEQIESILAQTEKNWKLVIQDDCSTDKTIEVAQSYADANPDKIKVVRRKKPSGSADKNFSSMLDYVDTEYWMLCDQDDIWLHNKIEVTLEKMHNLERQYGSVPLLVHTDLLVADKNCTVISESLFKYQKLNYTRDSFANLLVQNIVTGCTTLMNRILLDVVKAIPDVAIMHDWWLALSAAAFGKIGFVNQPTILYRQHGDNSIGAKDVGNLKFLLNRIADMEEVRRSLANTYIQAQSFLDRYREELAITELQICKSYVELPSLNKIQKISRLNKFNFQKSGMARKIGHLVFI